MLRRVALVNTSSERRLYDLLSLLVTINGMAAAPGLYSPKPPSKGFIKTERESGKAYRCSSLFNNLSTIMGHVMSFVLIYVVQVMTRLPVIT